MGKYNSSITRVRPVFRRLIGKDSRGREWLPKLLRLTRNNPDLVERLARDTGTILPNLLVQRKYRDRELGREIKLEECFEKSLSPCERFLSWLIENPNRMTWPDGGERKFGDDTQKRRKSLFGKNGSEALSIARGEALTKLQQHGAGHSKHEWWAFEGFTEVDCYLETERLVILIEGKRTEPVSSATDWYPQRNQLARNLEVGREAAGEKDFAVILVSEEPPKLDTKERLEQGLPHYTKAERDDIIGHYLGYVLWEDLCQDAGIDYSLLPNTVTIAREGRGDTL